MKIVAWIIAITTCLTVFLGGLSGIPWLFKNRVLPGIMLDDQSLGGMTHADLPAVLDRYEARVLTRRVAITLRQQQSEHPLGEFGVSLDKEATLEHIKNYNVPRLLINQLHIDPQLHIDEGQLSTYVSNNFSQVLKVPRDASLSLTPGGALQMQSGQPGETIDAPSLANSISAQIKTHNPSQPIMPVIVSSAPAILDHEVVSARQFADELLREGMELKFNEQSWTMPRSTVQRLLTFAPQADPQQPNNIVLGVSFDDLELTNYLQKTIAPEIDHPAQNARFEVRDERVEQFAMPEQGQMLDIVGTSQQINQALAASGRHAAVAVAITQPEIADLQDMTSLGITTLLAKGESSFAGSPRNRIHNIKVGTARYHGLLIPPNQEFSFNAFLGPITAAAGYKPELVIKNNMTIPEFGGGLCQVSTTIFRGAIHAGLPITQRRNHAYAVRYYGRPGFDATIYPPSTDLKFRNDTPGYVLLQTKIEGAHLTVEVWGTHDGRRVEVDGPRTYGAQPDGSVKAVLTRNIWTADGRVKAEDSFYSRYRSPNLFPKVASAVQKKS